MKEKRKKKKEKKENNKGGDRSYTLNYTFTVIEKSVSERATVNEQMNLQADRTFTD